MHKLESVRLSETFAGEIKNFKITDESIENQWASIYAAFLEYKVIVFKQQDLTPAIFAKFGKIFGDPEIHHIPAMRHPEEQTLVMLSNQNEVGRNPIMKWFGDGWHSDSSYKRVPACATMLWGTQIPQTRADTLFSNSEAAFSDLPESEKKLLRKLRVRHQYRWAPDRNDPWARWKFVGEGERRATPEVVHSLIRRHPDTGKECLFLAPRVIGSVIGIQGMATVESDALIDQLIGHMTSDKYQYSHQWSNGDVIVWDNRCLLHSATTKELPAEQVRRLLRITIKGSPVTPSEVTAGATIVVPDPEFA